MSEDKEPIDKYPPHHSVDWQSGAKRAKVICPKCKSVRFLDSTSLSQRIRTQGFTGVCKNCAKQGFANILRSLEI